MVPSIDGFDSNCFLFEFGKMDKPPVRFLVSLVWLFGKKERKKETPQETRGNFPRSQPLKPQISACSISTLARSRNVEKIRLQPLCVRDAEPLGASWHQNTLNTFQKSPKLLSSRFLSLQSRAHPHYHHHHRPPPHPDPTHTPFTGITWQDGNKSNLLSQFLSHLASLSSLS